MHKGVIPSSPLSPYPLFHKMVKDETAHALAVRPAGTFFCPPFFCPYFCFGCGSAATRSPRSQRFDPSWLPTPLHGVNCLPAFFSPPCFGCGWGCAKPAALPRVFFLSLRGHSSIGACGTSFRWSPSMRYSRPAGCRRPARISPTVVFSSLSATGSESRWAAGPSSSRS